MSILDALSSLPPEQAQGLLATGLGILANNTGHYGAFGPAVGAGGLTGLQSYQNQMQQKRQYGLQTRGLDISEAYKQMQEKLLAQQTALMNLQVQQQGGLSNFYKGLTPPQQSQQTQTQPSQPTQATPLVSDASSQVTAPPVGVNPTQPPPQQIGAAQYWLSRAQQADDYLKNNGFNPLIMKERDDALKQANDARQRFLGGVKEVNGRIISVDPDATGTTTLERVPKQPEWWAKTDQAGNITGIDPLYKQYEIQKAEAGAVKTQVQVNAQLPASEAAQKDFMDKTAKNYDVLRNAPSDIQNLELAKQNVAKAGPFVGAFAEKKLALIKAINNNLPFVSIAPEEVSNAEELRARLFGQVLGNLKKLDAQPSQQQQEIMQQAMGNLTTDPKALIKVIDVYQDIIRNKVALHNKEVQSSIGRGVKFPYDPLIELPPKQSAVTQQMGWTPDKERRLRELELKRGSQ